MDRDTLRKAITSRGSPLLEAVANQQMYSGYRVVVYRMNTKGIDVRLPNGKSYPIDYLMSLDPSSYAYIEIVNSLADDKENNFLLLVNAIYKRLDAVMAESKASKTPNTYRSAYRRGHLVEEFDITPIVQNISSSICLEEPNSCNFTCVDPVLADVGVPEIQRVYELNPWLKQLTTNAALNYEGVVSRLKTFKFREFDLVRVYGYSSLSKSLEQKIDEVKKSLGYSPTQSTNDVLSLLTEYCLPVVFTGFVHGITNSNAPNATSSLTVQCLGLSRILSQTSMVVDQALANSVVITNRAAFAKNAVAKTAITPNSQIFAGKSAAQVFTTIMENNFYCKAIPGIQGEAVAGVASLSTLLEKTGFNDVKDKSGAVVQKGSRTYTGRGTNIPNAIPLFNNLVALHYIKEKFSEPIYICEDALAKEQLIVSNANSGFANRADSSLVYNKLRPYLLMLKENFALYDSTYKAPYEVLEDIRVHTFMEIFEGRNGSFNLRFPQYNNAIIDVPLSYDNMLSVEMTRSDSNNYTIVQTRHMADLYGAFSEIKPEVFIDPLCMLRFGFRVSGVIESPNAISEAYCRHLGKFMKHYGVLRESRSATITIVGQNNIEVGQMVSFLYGYKTNIADSNLLNSGVGSNRETGTYVGYITQIQDNITPDQGFTQTLTLKYVREASVCGYEDSTKVRVARLKTLSQILHRSLNTFSTSAPDIIKKLFGTLNVLGARVTSASPTLPVVNVMGDKRETYYANFSYIPSSVDLASFYLSQKGTVDDERGKAQLGARDTIRPATAKEIKASIGTLKAEAEGKLKELAIRGHQSFLLSYFAAEVNKEFMLGNGRYVTKAKVWLSEISPRFNGITLKEEYTTGWDKIEGGLQRCLDAAMAKNNKTHPSVYLNIKGLPPGYDWRYGKRAVPVDMVTNGGEYKASTQIMVNFANDGASQFDGVEHNFQREFTDLLSSGNITVKQWEKAWRLFIDGLMLYAKLYAEKTMNPPEYIALINTLRDQTKALEAANKAAATAPAAAVPVVPPTDFGSNYNIVGAIKTIVPPKL